MQDTMRFQMIEVAGRKVNINVREFNVRMLPYYHNRDTSTQHRRENS